VINVLCSNTDDHGKNHAAFWDGRTLTLTPGYDISPQRRSGETARQAMAYAPIAPGTDGINSRVADVIAAASIHHLDRSEAGSIVDAQVTTMRERWDEVCDQARLGSVDRARLWGGSSATRQRSTAADGGAMMESSGQRASEDGGTRRAFPTRSRSSVWSPRPCRVSKWCTGLAEAWPYNDTDFGEGRE